MEVIDKPVAIPGLEWLEGTILVGIGIGLITVLLLHRILRRNRELRTKVVLVMNVVLIDGVVYDTIRDLLDSTGVNLIALYQNN